MKRVEDKFYNISTAKPLITVTKTFGEKYGKNPDVDWTETLFVKRSGEYFVYGKGGKDTPYSSYENGEAVPGEGYETWVSNNYNKARNWVVNNCPKEMDKIFVRNVSNDEDSALVSTSFTISKKAQRNLRRRAAEFETSASELIRQWAEKFYD